MPTTLLIVKNQGQPSNWSHYRNGSANALHFSAFRISIEAGEFQIEKINAGKLEKVLWSNVTVRDDSSGVPGTPITPTSPIDLANILEGLGYPAYSFTGPQTLQSVTIAGNTTTEDIEIGYQLGFQAGAVINDDGGQLLISQSSEVNIFSSGTSVGVSSDGNVYISSSNPTSRGLASITDFTPNITDLDFTQKKYVDDAIAGITPGGSLTIVPSTNITVDDTDPANPIVASQTNAAGDGTAITDGLVEHENLLANSLTAVADISGRDLIASRHALIDGNVVAVGTVSGSNLSGTNTGDNAINSTSQPLDSDLTAIAALTTTTFGRSLLTKADAAATRSTIGAGDGSAGTLTGTTLNSGVTASSLTSVGALNGLTLAGLLAHNGGTATGASAATLLANLLGTFNGTGVFKAIVLNITNTASNSQSRLIDLQTNSSSKFNVDMLGNAYASNSFTAGAYVEAGSTAFVSWTGRSRIYSPANGDFRLTNTAGTDFGKLQFGGSTSSFPAVKRNAATLEIKLADDSEFAAVQTLYDRFGAGSPESIVTAPVGAVYHRTDGGAGTSLYVKESGTGNTGWVAK